MIRNIDIKLNAAHPQLPILEATTFVGSPSAVMIHGVPPSVGAWRINAVRVVATYPDNTAHTVAAVLGAAGTWVATIPATETSGRVKQGLQILADGTDERGESVTGYVLGIAGLAVYTRDMTIESAAGVKYYIHLLDDEPAEPKEGDAYLNGSTLVIYHDGEWTGIGGGSVELDNTVTRTSGNGVKSSGIWSAIWGALTALPTGFSSLYDWCAAQLEKKYEKPQNGIPKTDLSAGVQASLGKADTALQTAPVTSVNGKTGAVSLSASDVGAAPSTNIGFVAFSDQVQSLLRKANTAVQPSTLADYAPLASPAFEGTPTAPTPTAGDNSTKVATTAFVQAAVAGVPLRYDMPTAVALVAENDAATLVCADRAVTNATIADGFSTLNLTFPTAVSGKVRDFYLRITVSAGESAPALSIPQDITIENPDGVVPEIADGETSAASTTLVWFSETATNVFTAKSETVKAVA